MSPVAFSWKSLLALSLAVACALSIARADAPAPKTPHPSASDAPTSAPIKLLPTNLFFRLDKTLYQAVWACAAPSPGELVTVLSDAGEATFNAETLPRYGGKLVVPVPPAEKSQRVEARISGSGRRGVVELPPTRKWTIYIVPHTHLDIGYTDSQENVWRDLAKNLDGVIDLCRRTADWPEGSQYRWTIEQTALFENFALRYPKERVEALVKLIREDRIELAGYWVNLCTELAGPEGLIRGTYSGRRLADRYGLTVDTVMLNDVPGYTWCLPQLWSKTGARYANLRANGARAKFLWDRPGAVPRAFRWEGPDGSRLVCWYTDSYREANFLRQRFPGGKGKPVPPEREKWLYENINRFLRRAEATPYDRDVLQLRMGGDNITAVESVCHWVRCWNERWEYPKLRIATSREFFTALDDGKKEIPVVRGDIPDWWADGAASSAEQTGQARIAHDQAVALETLMSLPEGPVSASQEKTFRDIHNQILLYAEHTWGAETAFHRTDPKMVEGQWAVKRGYVDTAIEQLESARQDWDRAVDAWTGDGRKQVIVWNSLSWPRTGLVELPSGKLPPGCALMAPDGRRVPVVSSTEGRSCFVARDVPAMGYALYAIDPGPANDDPNAAKKSPSLYQIEFDAKQGAVRQIRHRPTGQTLLETSPRFAFNQYVRETGGYRNELWVMRSKKRIRPEDKTVHVSEPAELVEHVRTPVFERITTRTTGPVAPTIEQSYTAYPDLDWIDVVNRVKKTSTLEVEGVYFAFPFAMKSPDCRLEIPFSSMRPGKDQLRYSATDCYSLYHWLELSDRDHGLLWASIEAPNVVFNDLWPECWTDEVNIDTGLILSYVMNNYWGTNYRFEQGGDLVFRYRIQSYAGQPRRVRSFRFGHEAATPLSAQVVSVAEGSLPKTRSWFRVEPDHVILQGFKRAEDGRGWIARLVELGDADTTARLRLPKGEWKACLADPAERDEKPLSITATANGPTMTVPMRRGEIVTLRMQESTK